MRVIIAAPRKSGSAQLRCLIAMAYGLKGPASDAPSPAIDGAVAAWVNGLASDSVSTCDLAAPLLTSAAEAANVADVALVAIVRHPFDLFLSNYEVAQQRATRQREDVDSAGSWVQLAGLDLASAGVEEYARASFGEELTWLRDWTVSGAPVIRYESLLEAPAATLLDMSASLGVLSPEQAQHAVALCPAENAVASRPGRGRRMPAVTPGSWRTQLPPPLLATLRVRHASDIAALGYDVD